MLGFPFRRLQQCPLCCPLPAPVDLWAPVMGARDWCWVMAMQHTSSTPAGVCYCFQGCMSDPGLPAFSKDFSPGESCQLPDVNRTHVWVFSRHLSGVADICCLSGHTGLKYTHKVPSSCRESVWLHCWCSLLSPS